MTTEEDSDIKLATHFGGRVLVLTLSVLLVLRLLEITVPFPWLTAIPGSPVDNVSLKARLLEKEGSMDGGILLTGDSVISSSPSEAQDKRAVSAFLQKTSSAPVFDVSALAYHQRVYLSQLRALEFVQAKPRAFILGINLRSFCPNWEQNPYYRHKDAIDFANFPFGIALYRAWRIFEPESTPKELFEEWDIRLSTTDPSHTAERGFKEAYCMSLAESSTIGSLSKSLELAKALPFDVYFYITPVNYEKAQEHLEPEDYRILEDNLKKVRALLEKSDLIWADYSHSLDSQYFYHPELHPDEHLTAPGREWLAQRLSELIDGNSNDEVPSELE